MHPTRELTDTTTQATPLIYFFGDGQAEGDPDRTDLMGGKGASLIAMSRAGLPVPPGFTISIACCRHYHEHDGQWPEGLEGELRRYVARLEESLDMSFGQGAPPLLVSVRSGAARSMPGMMDTILNCGLHPGLAKIVADEKQFWRVYEAFVRQFGRTVANIATEHFDDAVKKAVGDDPADDIAAAKAAAEACIALYERDADEPFPRTPWGTLRTCVNAVFDSWNNHRARVYRQAHGLSHLQGTAVTVQAMFNSEVSGIAFTANPSNPAAEEIIIESSYGLGESIVSGDVAPDRFVLDAKTLEIKVRDLGRKDHVMVGLGTTAEGDRFDPAAASLTDEQLTELAGMAIEVEKFFGHEVDIEWGLVGGKFALLQARGIRGLDVARDVEVGREQEIVRLKQQVAGKTGKRGKVWIVHNLSETLESPTDLTWDIIRKFMRGDGGFGRMYQDLGYRPSRRVREEGFLELICGRVYADADRAAELFWEGMPFEYDHNAVLENPRLLESAPTKFEADRTDGRFLLRLPATIVAMFRAARITRKARRDALRRFTQDIAPPYEKYVDERRAEDLTKRSVPELLDALHERVQRVLIEFGNESLKPGFFGGVARAELEAKLVQLMGPDEGPSLVRTLTSGLEGDSTVELNQMLFEVGRGKRTLDTFLEAHGHRAVGEMELSRPRWREDPSYIKQIVATQSASDEHSPAVLHEKNAERRNEAMRELGATLAEWGGGFLEADIRGLAEEAQQLLPYREVGKHYLLMGYETIRHVLVELGARWQIGADVFHLHLDELSQFEAHRARLIEQIAARKVRWQAWRRLDLPEVVDSRQLDTLGMPREIEAASEMDGLSLSPGVVTGTARVIFDPAEARDLPEDCIVICPSTDPGWTALFTSIRGLVVERGGVLSHGAITARDFSIPAVSCADATQIIPDGAKVRVDGDRGHITVIEG